MISEAGQRAGVGNSAAGRWRAFAPATVSRGRIVSKYQSHADKREWRAERNTRNTKAHGRVSQLTGQDGGINYAGFSQIWSAPKARMAAAIPGRVLFGLFLKNRDLGRPLSLRDLRNVCRLGTSINSRPSCLSLSFRLAPLPLPLRPCGFCHLFTGEWPLHRRDLNVSLLSLSLSLGFSPSSPYPASPCAPPKHFLRCAFDPGCYSRLPRCSRLLAVCCLTLISLDFTPPPHPHPQ